MLGCSRGQKQNLSSARRDTDRLTAVVSFEYLRYHTHYLRSWEGRDFLKHIGMHYTSNQNWHVTEEPRRVSGNQEATLRDMQLAKRDKSIPPAHG